ncbi:MAG: patatin-like phospholipase family protein [Burkholderiaceae bacterium]
MRIFGRKKASVINLALQGGGAHGAFTWGVLDALLEDGRIHFDGISGTSAGAMNAVVLAQGMQRAGRDGARAALQAFWTAVAQLVPDALTHTPAGGQGAAYAPMVKLMMQWTQYLTPQQLNPFDLDPLRDIVDAQIDFEQLRRGGSIKLFVATTEVNTGKLRLFRNKELSSAVLLASACLPTLHRAIEIDGQPYWDGGYSANPAVFPLFFECKACDTLLVLLNPLRRQAGPESAADIQARIAEIAFNSTFLREMRMFAHLREHLPRSWLGRQMGTLERTVQAKRFHLIEAGELLGGLGTESKLVVQRRFFEQLMKQGREHGQAWLEQHFDALGKRSTVDLDSLFY